MKIDCADIKHYTNYEQVGDSPIPLPHNIIVKYQKTKNAVFSFYCGIGGNHAVN
jgi:hypothetical protein